MVQPWLPARMSMPATDDVALKKSKMLLLSMIFPMFTVLLPAVPNPVMHLIGRLPPAGPMLLLEITLLLLPTMLVPEAVVVLKRIFPPAAPSATVDDPRIVQFLTVLFFAPPAAAVVLIKRMVLVPAVAETVVFENVSVPNPSMVTFLAPFKSTNGLPAAIAPETVRVPTGVTMTEV